MLSRKARILEEGTVPEGTKTTAAIRWKFDPSAEKAKEMWFAEKTNFLFRGTDETMRGGGRIHWLKNPNRFRGPGDIHLVKLYQNNIGFVSNCVCCNAIHIE
jgi:hypothetical protein